MADILVFAKRGRVHETAVARRTVWMSRCGGYRVVRSHYTVGGSNGYADVFYAEVSAGGGAGGNGAGVVNGAGSAWQVITKHRKRRAAEEACQRHARQQVKQQARQQKRASGGEPDSPKAVAPKASGRKAKSAAEPAAEPGAGTIRQRLLFGEIEPRKRGRR